MPAWICDLGARARAGGPRDLTKPLSRVVTQSLYEAKGLGIPSLRRFVVFWDPQNFLNCISSSYSSSSTSADWNQLRQTMMSLCLSSLALLRPLDFAVRTTVTRAALLTEESKSFHAIGYNIVSAHCSRGLSTQRR